MKTTSNPALKAQSRHVGGLRSMANASLHGRIAWWGLLALGLTYTLFQKKMLPRPISKIVARLLFYPTYPFTYMLRLKNWHTSVDDTLILGVAPMSLLGHPQVRNLALPLNPNHSSTHNITQPLPPPHATRPCTNSACGGS